MAREGHFEKRVCELRSEKSNLVMWITNERNHRPEIIIFCYIKIQKVYLLCPLSDKFKNVLQQIKDENQEKKPWST